MKGIEIQLGRIEVEENGELGKKVASSLISAQLLYPRPNVHTVTALKAIRLADASPIDFTTGTNPQTGEAYGYSERVLFKEEVAGTFELVVEVITIHQTSKVDKALAKLFGTAFGVAWGLALGGIASLPIGEIANMAKDAHLKSFDQHDPAFVVGRAKVTLDSKTLPATLRLHLTVPSDVDFSRFETKYGRPVRTTTRLVSKGQPNGVVELVVGAVE
ncbi:MAG TPA: hypothetical protein VF701_13165 [Thermoanaerobaculia bacterium]